MEDRELLTLAAKAVGILWSESSGFRQTGEFGVTGLPHLVKWNPLNDDGDALRLAVNLQLGISIPPVVDGRIEVVTFYGPIISIVEYPQNNDRNAATRRAIVRTAAEIGKYV